MTWDVPVAENCPECMQTLFKTSGRGSRKPFCINESCSNYLPEDKRGYRRKPDDSGSGEPSSGKPAKTSKAKSDKATTQRTKQKKTGTGKKASSKSASRKKADK